MKNEIPESKLKRSIVSGKTAAKVGGKVLKYYTKKPFLSKEKQTEAKADLDQKNAEILLKGFSLLKGTALKIAQFLSLESDIVPSAIQKELEKSYNQVSPINRALVRKIIQNSFNEPLENIYSAFDTNAFSAASLGQVHYATTQNGEHLAVKIQYPGISKTIKNDIELVKNFLKPLPDYKLILPVIKEVEARLFEEVDYLQEAENIAYFSKNLNLKGVTVPYVNIKVSSSTVLSMEYLSGTVLNEWINTNPPAEQRNKVAQTIFDIFLKSFYELNCIHADPNPGNFIIQDNLNIGLVDFGCVRRFEPEFISLYLQMHNALFMDDRTEILRTLKALHFFNSKTDPKIETKISTAFSKFSRWFSRPYKEDVFDFRLNSDFLIEGKKLMNEFSRFRNHFNLNPDFVFFDRTRYGLFRLFERMQARVKFRNPYEGE